MKLSIITINLNNANGLIKTFESVLNQKCFDFEYILIDGSSIDRSIEFIKNFENDNSQINFKWISEPDSGIYNAMNKGIGMSSGDYIQFLNSGDQFASSQVLEVIIPLLNNKVDILYGNMIKPINKKIKIDKGFAGKTITFMDFYNGTLNHSPTFIKKTLFDNFGLYNENLKIVSDWKWFMDAIIFNNITPKYIDINITIFDMTGISNSNPEIERIERETVLLEKLPPAILLDYKNNSYNIEQISRLNKYFLLRIFFYLLERIICKIEKLKV